GALKRDLRASNSYSSLIAFVKEDFTPPEQQHRDASRPEGFHTDIFALAGTMFYALAGQPPPRVTSRFLGGDDPYRSIAECSRIKCPPEIYAAIDRGLRLPNSERPQTIGQLQAMLGWSG